MCKIKCENCQKEVNSAEIDMYSIKISNDTSYRYNKMFLCVKCSEESKIYTIEPFYKSLKIIVDILRKKGVDNKNV